MSICVICGGGESRQVDRSEADTQRHQAHDFVFRDIRRAERVEFMLQTQTQGHSLHLVDVDGPFEFRFHPKLAGITEIGKKPRASRDVLLLIEVVIKIQADEPFRGKILVPRAEFLANAAAETPGKREAIDGFSLLGYILDVNKKISQSTAGRDALVPRLEFGAFKTSLGKDAPFAFLALPVGKIPVLNRLMVVSPELEASR